MKNFYILITLIIFASSVSDAQVTWGSYFVNTGATTIYDLGSNSSPQWIAQDPNTPANIHAVIMSAPFGDPATYPNRRTKYYFSSNGGTTWDFITTVNDRKSGFPSINVASDGCAYICNYGSTTSNTSTHTIIYGDVFPGIGSFLVYEPAASAGNYFFAKFCMTSNLVLSTKFIMMGQSFTSDSTFRITGPSPWGTWTSFTRTTPETYSAARGTDGRLGIVYMQTGTTTTDYRNIYFIQSTNNGTTFSAPLNIFQAIFEGAGADSLAAFRGLSLAYKGNVPCATFEAVKQDPTAGSYDMTAPAKIMFWSPELPGSDPFKSITIADKTNVPIPPPDSIKTGVNDQFGSLSRPVIGVSSDNNTIIIVFQAFTNKWGGLTDTTNFKALYVTKATNNYNFSRPSNFTSWAPLKDWSYPSISTWNDKTSQNIFANICALSDSIPGTYVNANGNGQSLATLYYIKLTTAHTVGINPSETAVKFSLEQNYPNPFNPVTNIKYQIPKDGFIKLAVYDLLGRELEVLINEKQSTGVYETSWNASRYSSGVYFYKLTSNGFTETKRMLLIK